MADAISLSSLDESIFDLTSNAPANTVWESASDDMQVKLINSSAISRPMSSSAPMRVFERHSLQSTKMSSICGCVSSSHRISNATAALSSLKPMEQSRTA